jgi:hypothetical protein
MPGVGWVMGSRREGSGEVRDEDVVM